jgi:hypothetical protein
MKKHLLAFSAILITTALVFAADSRDTMFAKIFGTDKAPSVAPEANTAHALTSKDNTVVVNAWSGGLEFQGETFDTKSTKFAFTDPTADRLVTFPDGSGTVSLHAKAVLTPASTVSFAPASSVSTYTLTPGQSETINAVTTGAIAGRPYYLVITTSGTSSYTLTFGTNFKTTGTLATGTTSAKKFVVTFIFDGTSFCEASRTTAM